MKVKMTLLMLIILVGCASVKPVTEMDLIAEGNGTFSQGFSVFYLPSRGAMADAIAKAQGATREGNDLYKAFQLSRTNNLGIVVGGSNSERILLVVEHALNQEKGSGLTGLEVLLVGPTTLSSDLIKKSESLGVSIILSSQ